MRAKAAAKEALRPVANPVLARFYARLDSYITPRLEEVRADSAVRAEHLRVLLDHLSAMNAATAKVREELGATQRSLADTGRYVLDLEQRMAAWRTEILYELRYGATSHGMAEAVEAKVVNPDRLEQRPLKLNLGSGRLTMDGFVNVDGRPLDGVDVVADVRAVPLDAGSVDEIHAAHLLEHFPGEEVRRVVLPHWVGLLRSGGVLRVVVPDAEAMLEAYARGEMSFDDLRLVTFGEQEYDGDFHFTMFSREALRGALAGAGLEQVELTATARRNGASLEMEAVGVKA